MSTELAFHDHKFTVTPHNNQIYLTVTQIGLALNYANPETAVTKIFNRHKDEFTGLMTTMVKLASPSGPQETRIFSLRGAHLIAMFARTPVAKEFRRWVLDILDKETGQPTTQPAQQEFPDLPEVPHTYSILTHYVNDRPVARRRLKENEVVITYKSMMGYLRERGLIFFTVDELKNLSYADFLAITGS
ncbi:BRO-N domain-containing protein [Klebsiella aerogenes]|uniref:BRO-N domain-containing protein n=1 Tax=Klebsiella aerogenes TaxID=548 RepID=UPI001F2A6168|nr:BRO family protein [Klebsiella aerogenes]